MNNKIKRDFNGNLLENCKENIGVKIGSFDCTANCPHNQNTKKEIQEHGFDLESIKCSKIIENNNNQFKIQI